MNAESRTHLTDLQTVAIPVSDQERALDLYLGTLGFEKRRDTPFGPVRWIEVAPPGAATTIALVPPGGGQRPGVDTCIRLTTEDANADHSHLVAGGVHADRELMRFDPAPPMFGFRDPDGNRLVIAQRA
jgi:catechol 2,3-dioxygenase-like lactoylglutathione lyase family enzyme